MRLFILLTFLVTLPIFGWAQTTFNYGPEVGASISQFPVKEHYIVESRGDKVTEKTMPVNSPVLGFYGQVTIGNHLELSSSLQYQKTGKVCHYHRDGNDLLAGGTYTSDNWESQTFQKLCLPLTIGYQFRIGKLESSAFGGVRPNFIFSGDYTYKSDFNHTNDSEDYKRNNQFNPLNPDEAGIPAKRFRNQLLVGFSTVIGHHLQVKVMYSAGMAITYSQYKPSGFEGYHGKSMLNSDIGLTFAYRLNSPGIK